MYTENVLVVDRWVGVWGMGKEVRGLGSTNRLQNSHGDVKYGVGNGAAKELVHMTHGHK